MIAHPDSWAAYAAHPGINWSRLKVIGESPAHYRRAQPIETPALAFGRYVHTAILQPERLSTDFAIFPGERRETNAWKAFAAENAGRTLFKASEVAAATPLIEAVRAHPFVRALLADESTQTEQIVTWLDDVTGLDCKARPDIFHAGRRLVADLKTAASTEIRRFGSAIARYEYHGQLAHYADGIAHARGWTPETHVLIVVEKEPPFDVAIFPLAPSVIETGRERRDALLATLAECLASDHWPGRYPEPLELSESNLPPWMFGGGIPEFEFVTE